MAKKFARVNVSGLLKKVEGVEREAKLANEDLQIEAARAGEQKMVEIIETSGTGNSPWGYYVKSTGKFRARSLPAKIKPRRGNLKPYGGSARVNTGNMRDSVGVRFEGSGDNLVSAFGWIRNYEEYFTFQEEGFEHRQAKIRVPGMFALRDARRYVVKQVLPRLVKKYQNRLARGTYR